MEAAFSRGERAQMPCAEALNTPTMKRAAVGDGGRGGDSENSPAGTGSRGKEKTRCKQGQCEEGR